jgi:L,D-transpeptidase catalytic domain
MAGAYRVLLPLSVLSLLPALLLAAADGGSARLDAWVKACAADAGLSAGCAVNLRAEPVTVVVDVDGREARVLVRGQEAARYDVGQGQAEGKKEWRGDLRTPRGTYFVVSKSTGPFGGTFGGYYGGIWLKVNYPGPLDAARGLDAGVITPAQAEGIAAAWSARKPTPQTTRLGGGIGFHAWIDEWDGADGGYLLSWGCLVVHPRDAQDFYRRVPLGAPVVLL